MNVLKHGSKLVSVGLLSLSMSAGFSGLAFAQTPDPAISVTPNPAVLDNSSLSLIPAYDSFAVVVSGTGLIPGTTYVVTDNIACTTDNLNTQTQVANNNRRVTFSANEAGCVPGIYTVTLRTPTALGTQVATATLTVLDPQTAAPAPTPAPTPTPAPGPFPGPHNGQFDGQFGAGHQAGFAGHPTGFAGRPSGFASRHGGQTRRFTNATSRDSDDALFVELLKIVAR